MALRDQPYLPLYIQDIMTDEKLNECSAATHGIYIKGIMCLMHKSEQYGKILLKQKDKQTAEQNKNFAIKIAKHLPYSVAEVEAALTELLHENVLFIDGDQLCQKRMIKDNELSQIRANSGKKGGDHNKIKTAKNSKKPTKKFASTFAQAKPQANPEYEYENDIEVLKNKVKSGKVETVIHPFDSDNWYKAWERWIQYRKDSKKPYKSVESIQAQLSWFTDNEYSEEVSIAIIDKSIRNSWQGLFEINKQHEQKQKSNGKGIATAVIAPKPFSATGGWEAAV